jgi:hypothetical protein
VRVSVHQQGGAFGVDRLVEVDGDRICTTEDGVERRGVLDPDTRQAVHDLATKTIAHPDVQAASGLVYDAMATQIEIDDGSTIHSLTVRSGDEAPDAVWGLINLVGDAPDRASPEGHEDASK